MKTKTYRQLTEIQTAALFVAIDDALSLLNRDTNPDGHFDSGGRFYLATGCPHCGSVRSPSRAWPYPEMLHGRTLKHNYHQHEKIHKFVSESEFRGLALSAQKQDAEDYKRGLALALAEHKKFRANKKFLAKLAEEIAAKAAAKAQALAEAAEITRLAKLAAEDAEVQQILAGEVA